MEGAAFEEAKEAARLFVRRMGTGVAAAIVSFSEDAVLAQPLTPDPEALVEAINGLELGDKAALYDGAYLAVSEAAGAPAVNKLVVLLTDSQDSQSDAEREAALELAEVEGVQVFTVSLGEDADSDYLEMLSAATNGLRYDAATPDELLSIYESLVMQFAEAEGDLPTAPTAIETLTPVASVEIATAVVLAIDTTGSMEGPAFEAAQAAVRLFIQRMGSGVEASIVSFSDQAIVEQRLTTDREALIAAINRLELGNRAALYDGAYLAVSEAADASAQERIVVLLTDSRERDNQSAAEREAALELAEAEGVQIFTISLGEDADSSYLNMLSTATNGLSYEVVSPSQLRSIYDTLVLEVATPDAERLLTTDATRPSLIPPVENPIDSLNLGPEPVLPDNLGVYLNEQLLTSHVTPITISISPDIQVEWAELMLNGYTLATFSEAPFEYDLDTLRLSAGQYRLTFSVTNTSGVVSTGTLDFEVMLLDRSPERENADFDVENILNIPGNTSFDILPKPLNAEPLPRVLLINGEVQPFNLRFSLAEGLVLAAPLSSTEAAPTESLMDILTRPVHLIPEPVTDALMVQRPELWTAVVLIIVIMLLPQGIFTLYWMLYSWSNPDTAEQFRSPKEYAPPTHSFTAIIPARREEDVIKDTIRAVDRIDYPEHLKEILVMIRDEDDDGTIARTKEAIAELGKGNIRLITFTSGPRNKPNGLNRGLKAAKNQVVCVFDAEDEPHPDIYNIVNTVMVRDGADVVQSGVQLMNFRSTWFSALNCLEYFFWFKSGLQCFTRKLKVTPLGGNTVFFKKHWLERIGGWDESCLTEDADIGIRLSLASARIQIVYDQQHATQEETPATVESFIKQRTRWCQGFYQIFAKGDWRRLPTIRQKLAAVYILLNSLLQAAIIFYLPLGLYIALTQKISVPATLLSFLPIYLLFLQLITNLVGIREFTVAYGLRLPFLFRLKMALIYYPYQLLLALSALRAVGRFVMQNQAWEKTEHANLHRQQVVTRGV